MRPGRVIEVDVAVVGAGVAGCVTAHLLSSKGLDVALLEVNKRERVGEKVCGDGVGRHEFSDAHIDPPTSGVDREIKGVRIYTSFDDLAFTIMGSGYSLDRKKFGQDLLSKAIMSGAKLYDRTFAEEPIVTGERVVGVKSLDLDSRRDRVFRSKIVVDASGFSATIRKRLPRGWWIHENIHRWDIGLGYREIRRTEACNGDFCELYYDREITRGGYCWVIPKRDGHVNTGILIFSRDRFDVTWAKKMFTRFLTASPTLSRSQLISSGVGLVPLRRPLSCPIGGGFVAVGDAALHPNPFNGGGLGPAMVSAASAADAAHKAIESGDASLSGLWRYNTELANRFFARYAVNEVIKNFIYNLSLEEGRSFFRCLGVRRCYGSGDFLKELTCRDYLKAMPQLLRTPRLSKELVRLLGRVKSVKDIYSRYPETPDRFQEWRAAADAHFLTY
ncbi:MAG: NAD(P)/FAD-dependent oxidoreductase [Candidatus Bathyarchaeia archaeon]